MANRNKNFIKLQKENQEKKLIIDSYYKHAVPEGMSVSEYKVCLILTPI